MCTFFVKLKWFWSLLMAHLYFPVTNWQCLFGIHIRFMCYALDFLIRAMTVVNCVFVFLYVLFIYFSVPVSFGGWYLDHPYRLSANWLMFLAKDSLHFVSAFATYRGQTVLWCLAGWCFFNSLICCVWRVSNVCGFFFYGYITNSIEFHVHNFRLFLFEYPC